MPGIGEELNPLTALQLVFKFSCFPVVKLSKKFSSLPFNTKLVFFVPSPSPSKTLEP